MEQNHVGAFLGPANNMHKTNRTSAHPSNCTIPIISLNISHTQISFRQALHTCGRLLVASSHAGTPRSRDFKRSATLSKIELFHRFARALQSLRSGIAMFHLQCQHCAHPCAIRVGKGRNLL